METSNYLDYSFAYDKTFRSVMLDKLLLQNSFACQNIRTSTLLLELSNLENFDSARLVAAMFILRLLSQKRPYIVKFGLFQTFYAKQYDATVQVTLSGKAVFNIISLLSTEILPFLSKTDFLKFVKIGENKGCTVFFTVLDLSFLRVVETHSIFFKWHDKVHIRFDLTSNRKEDTDLFLSLFNL